MRDYSRFAARAIECGVGQGASAADLFFGFNSPAGAGIVSAMADAKIAAAMRLATYGTLAPGRVNHHQLAALEGFWRQGTVHGRLVEAGWGAKLGFPGLILDPAGEAVEVHVFESLELPDHWLRLDAFEGAGYRRVVAQARTPDGALDVSIYVIET